MALRNLHYYQEYGAKEEAVRQFFNAEAPDGQFHSTYDIPASDRRKFEELFGRHADYTAEDITRIHRKHFRR